MWKQLGKEDFLKALEEHMRNQSTLKERSIVTYLRRIRWFLENGYSVNDLCGSIETLIKGYSAKGQKYNAKDHSNNSAALYRVKLMVKHPYIHYQKGYASFVPKGRHNVEYRIDGDTITIGNSIGFCAETNEVKRISKKMMTELIAILDEAKEHALFAKSNTYISTPYGFYCTYEYRYCDESGDKCGTLFSVTPKAEALFVRYDSLLKKLLK